MKTKVHIKHIAETQPAASTADATPFVAGAIFTRGFGFIQQYVPNAFSSAIDPNLNGWIEHAHVNNMWLHPGFPGHAAYRDCASGTWSIIQRLQGQADRSKLESAAHGLFGPLARPVRSFCYPLALRVPLRIRDGADLQLPAKTCRCRRIRESSYTAIHGLDVEQRLSVSVLPGREPRLWSETFTSPHLDHLGNPRCLMYVGDLRKLVCVGDLEATARLTSDLIEAAIVHAKTLEDSGLVIDPVPRGSGRRFAKVYGYTALNMMVFDVRLPQPDGDVRFLLVPARHWMVPVDANNDALCVIGHLPQVAGAAPLGASAKGAKLSTVRGHRVGRAGTPWHAWTEERQTRDTEGGMSR